MPAGTLPLKVTTSATWAISLTFSLMAATSAAVTSRPGSKNSVETPCWSSTLMQQRVSLATSTKSCSMPSASRRSQSKRPLLPPTKPVARIFSPQVAMARAAFKPLPPALSMQVATRITVPSTSGHASW